MGFADESGHIRMGEVAALIAENIELDSPVATRAARQAAAPQRPARARAGNDQQHHEPTLLCSGRHRRPAMFLEDTFDAALDSNGIATTASIHLQEKSTSKLYY